MNRERLARAFSLRRNLRMLFVPPESHLRPLDGLRALSILWVVLFHAGWYSFQYLPTPMYYGMVVSGAMLPVWRGDFGVDVFFVVSGFLIAGMLIDQRARTGRFHLWRFYVRRLMRLWPALCVAAAWEVVSIDDNTPMIWANILYISNFFPIRIAAMGWTWSLAIEEQFYLVCPWLVGALVGQGARARVGVLAAITLALCVTGAYVVMSGPFFAFDSEIVVNRDFERWQFAYDHLYAKPWMRAGPLLAGVATAYAFRMPAVMDALAQRRRAATAGLVVAVVIVAVSTHWPLFGGPSRALEVLYLATYRTIFGLAVAYVLLLSLSRHPHGVSLGRFFSLRLFYPVAQLAYSAYLLNPIVSQLLHRASAPLVWEGKYTAMGLFVPLDAAGTFLAAFVLHLLVEKPFMELRPPAT